MIISKKNFASYLLGVITSAIIITYAFIQVPISFSYEEAIKEAAPNIFPIYINGEKDDLNAYNIDGRTYLSVSDLSSKTHIFVEWYDSTKEIRITDSSFLLTKEFDDKLYVDMTYWFKRYNYAQEINGEMATKVIPFTFSHNSIDKQNLETNTYESGFGIPMIQKDNSHWYLEYEYYKQYVHTLIPNIIVENEIELSKINNKKQ